MEREGCVASTQAAAFLQTAVAPQPHKQPHIGGNKEASTSQATSYLWKQRGLNLNALQPQPYKEPLSEERSSQYPHLHFWERASCFATSDLLTSASKHFRTLPALVFGEKVGKWQCDSVSYTISSCSTDTPLVPHTCVCFHQEKHIFKPFRIFGGKWKRSVPIQVLVTFDSAHICWWQFEAWETRLGMRGPGGRAWGQVKTGKSWNEDYRNSS